MIDNTSTFYVKYFIVESEKIMNSRFEICCDVSKNDIKKMINLDKESYFGNDAGDFERCLSWHKICKDLYTILKKDGKIIGYINFLPIKKSAYNKIRAGKLKDYELEKKDILPFRKGENYCLFMSIVLDKQSRFSRAVHMLLLAWNKRILKMKDDGIIIKNFLADCVTEEGKKLAKHFGGKLLCETSSKSSVFEFDRID